MRLGQAQAVAPAVAGSLALTVLGLFAIFLEAAPVGLAPDPAITPEAVVVVDMVGDADQQLFYEQSSDVPIREAVWQVAGELGYASFIPEPKYTVIDDHTPFLQRGFRAIDIIDFEYGGDDNPHWHTAEDTLDKLSPQSLKIVGDVVLLSLPRIEAQIK